MKPVLAAATLILSALPLHAQDVTISHGISAFGNLKYPAGFAHFDYVNPDAPKGGEISYRGFLASQTFDSLNLFILKGEPAQGLGLLYDSLLLGSADEPDSAYGMVAESLEYPEPQDKYAEKVFFHDNAGCDYAVNDLDALLDDYIFP